MSKTASLVEINHVYTKFEITDYEFYYQGTELVDNAYTACVLISNGHIASRGIAICSVLNVHCKSNARTYAMGRALKSLRIESNGSFINKDRWIGQFIKRKRKLDNSEEVQEFTEIVKKNNCVNLKINFDGQKNIYTAHYYLPLNHALDYTSKHFKYKYEYRPTPTEFEKEFFKLT